MKRFILIITAIAGLTLMGDNYVGPSVDAISCIVPLGVTVEQYAFRDKTNLEEIVFSSTEAARFSLHLNYDRPEICFSNFSRSRLK